MDSDGDGGSRDGNVQVRSVMEVRLVCYGEIGILKFE